MEALRISRLTKLVLSNGGIKLAQRGSKVLAALRFNECLPTKRWAELQVDLALSWCAAGESASAHGALAYRAGEAVREDAAAGLGGLFRG
jgi:hypothetical protein